MQQEYIEERLKTKGYVFDKRCKEGKVTFVIYMQTVSQSALRMELEMNENGVGRLFCNVIPTFPGKNRDAVEKELNRLFFLSEMVKFDIEEESIVAVSGFDIRKVEVERADDITLFSTLHTFKNEIEIALPGILYTIYKSDIKNTRSSI